ncbi:hypothetical protein BH23PAT1_BH23PAT1_1730 [soil metagenome]
MKEVFAVSSLIVSIAANIPYILETIKGKVKPERISWLLWTLLGGTYFFSAVFADGAKWFTFGELIGPVIILLLALKYGAGGKSRLDKYSLAVALIAFGLLFVLEGVLVSLLLALFIDGIGAFLTIRKLLIDPASESRSFWMLAAVAGFLALLSLKTYNLETVLFPAYVVVLSIFISSKANPAKEMNVKQVEKL